MCIVRSNYARAVGSLCPTLLNADPNEQHQRRERKVGRRRFASRRRRVHLSIGQWWEWILHTTIEGVIPGIHVRPFVCRGDESLVGGGAGVGKELWRCSVLLLSTGSSAEPH